MGTSQSSPGPGKDSPLVPPWADDEPQQPLPPPEARRFAAFRESLGRSISNGSKQDLKKAVGHYARKASGGSGSAVRRMGSVTRAGAGLYGLLTGDTIESGQVQIDLNSLDGLPCEIAIARITQALTTEDGDSDKIRASMNHALVEALDGVDVFDPSSITDSVIVDTMIGYLAESIFLQIVMDSRKAWNKADNHSQAIRAETSLRELIKVVVDKKMKLKLRGDVRKLNQQQVIQIEREAITESWKEWEAYQ